MLFGNNAAMAALSEQNREFLREAAQATIDVKTVNDHTHESEDVGILCRRGLIAFDQASPAQVDGLRHAYEPVYQWLREDTATSGFVDRIQTVVRFHTGRPGDRRPGRMHGRQHRCQRPSRK